MRACRATFITNRLNTPVPREGKSYTTEVITSLNQKQVAVTARLSTKKCMFPVQRLAVIVASRVATIFFPTFFVCLVGKYYPFFVSSRTFFSHLAAKPETELLFSMA